MVDAKTRMRTALALALLLCAEAKKDAATCMGGLDASMINDDFCDCPFSRNDEPLTSACAHAPNAKFLCESDVANDARANMTDRGNGAGRAVQKWIHASKVADGVCDCCSGGDEQPGLCPDTCAEEENARLAAAAAQLSLQRAGHEAKLSLISAAEKMYADLESEHAKIMQRISAGVEAVSRSRALLDEAGRLEASRKHDAVTAFEIRASAVLGIDVLDRRIQVGGVEFSSKTSSLATLITGLGLEHGRRLIQIAAEVASEGARKAEPLTSDKDTNKGAPVPQEVIPTQTQGSDTGIQENETFDLQSEWRSRFLEFKSPELREAETTVESAERELANFRRQLAENRKVAERDYGPNRVWWALDGKCASLKNGEFVYKVCIMQSAEQSGTNLGRFKGWTIPDSSREEMSSGTEVKPSHNERRMMFEGGTRCWNGPRRSMSVEFVCGAKLRLRSVEEPSKCVYTAVMEVPTECIEVENAAKAASDGNVNAGGNVLSAGEGPRSASGTDHEVRDEL